MVLYGINLLPLAEAMREEETGFLHPWYTDDEAMLGPYKRSTRILRALMVNGSLHGYFTERERICHIFKSDREED